MDAACRYARGYGNRARDYARVLDPTLAPVATEIIRRAALTGIENALDLATGTGTIARKMAHTAKSVVGVDISPGMITVAKDLSPPAICFDVCDAHALPFNDNSFDVVTCGFGLSHMPHVQVVLQEVRRVLCPGGCFIESSWGSDGENAAFDTVLGILRRHSGGKLHAFGDILDERTWAVTAAGCTVLRGAGFDPVEADTVALEGVYAGAEEALAWTLAWPDYGGTLDAMPAEMMSGVRREALQSLQKLREYLWRFDVNYYMAKKPR